jgi:hypothetical protein
VSFTGLGSAVAVSAALESAALESAVAALLAGVAETVSRWPAGRSFEWSGDAWAGEEKTATDIAGTSAAAAAAVFHLVPDIVIPFVT